MLLIEVIQWIAPGAPVWFVVICLVLSGFTLVLHSIRRKFGVGWLWLWVGASTVIMWLSFVSGWAIAGPAGESVFFSTGLFAPSILMLMLLVYAEHGAEDARRVLGGVVAISLIYQLMADLAGLQSRTGLVAPGWQAVLGGLTAFVAAMVVMAVFYQLLTNWGAPIPISLRFGLAFLLGTVVYAFAFILLGYDGDATTVTGSVPDPGLANLVAVAALTVPTAFYLHWQHQRGRRIGVQTWALWQLRGWATRVRCRPSRPGAPWRRPWVTG